MIAMDPFDAFRYYMSIKLHFESDTYDAIKYNYKTSAKPQSFWKRKDKYYFAKLARRFNEPNDLISYYVANFARADKTWIGDMIESEEAYSEHIRINQSMGYTFKQDLVKLSESCESFDELFHIDGEYPKVVKAYMEVSISIEAVVILHKLTGFMRKVKVTDPILWPTVAKKILKYEPFIQVDLKKMKIIVLEVFTS